MRDALPGFNRVGGARASGEGPGDAVLRVRFQSDRDEWARLASYLH